MKTLLITPTYLRWRNACHEQLPLFEKLFPEGVKVTAELAVQHFDQFDWSWAIEALLEGEVRRLAREHEARMWTLRGSITDALWWDYNSLPSHTPEEREVHLDKIRQAKLDYQRRAARIFAESFVVQGGRELMHGETCNEEP